MERLFSSAGHIFQPERTTLTDNNFRKPIIMSCKSKLVIENTALITKTFLFAVEMLKVTLHPEL